MKRCILGIVALWILPVAMEARAQDDPSEKTAAEASKNDESKKESAEEEKRKLDKQRRKLERDLMLAKLEADVADMQIAIQTRSGERAIVEATANLNKSQKALEHFQSEVAPLELEQASIRLDRAKYAAEHAKDELDELVAMYEDDDFAEMTKELVLRRGKRNLELAERNLQVEKTKIEHLKNEAHPRRRDELADKAAQARWALEKAELDMRKVQLESRISSMRARFKLEGIEEDLEEVERKMVKVSSQEALQE